jgi:ABC-type branched-subunit amino acid transport system substrate-binding protein
MRADGGSFWFGSQATTPSVVFADPGALLNLRLFASDRATAFHHTPGAFVHEKHPSPFREVSERRGAWRRRRCDTIKVGVLHSLSGTMAISETVLKDTVLMAIDEINAKGGVLGKKLEPVVVDPASNWPLFAEKARS